MAMLTVREAAARLGIGYSTLKGWIYKGSVRTTRTAGGHHRIRDTEVERLLARQGKPPRARRLSSPGGVLVSVSGRNRLLGVVEEVRRDGLLAQVRLRVGNQLLTAVITRDAADELRLRRGDEAAAIIKSTDVMVGRETGSGDPAAPAVRAPETSRAGSTAAEAPSRRSVS
ncbi:MAG: TOBE domain-containing protein [Acidobacteria bacterium]|nr:TOBE domain-containing protein [Acidobacteriota bacterium]